jgi:hypothetical protein
LSVTISTLTRRQRRGHWTMVVVPVVRV